MLVKVQVPTVPVTDGALFPVRRIYCVGRNYRAHALEMGGNPDREQPFFFNKHADSILLDGGAMPYPPQTTALEHEVELVVAIGARATDIAREHAAKIIFGYAAGLDMTRRDLQNEAKAQRRPWEMGKAFDHAAPVGAITQAALCGPMNVGAIWLDINGTRRQESSLSQMTWSVNEIIAELSRFVTLMPGDLIFTGTPENVGKVVRGDHLHAHIDGLTDLHVTIV